jgi:excinuclease ABC subunit A
MPQDRITIRGAREHNLKNVDLELPRNKLIVITGLSGSGKSSLAFDTIYAEGQRRYVESLSAYARQFLGLMEKPDVDLIDGLSPAISIDQKTAGRNPRSTVGTITEVYDYLRLLFARIGHPHCPNCRREISQQTVQQMVDTVMALPSGTRCMVLAPVVRGRKGEYQKLFDDLRRAGFSRVRVDGEVRHLDDPIPLERYRNHTIEVIVDRLVMKPEEERGQDRLRIADSLETALKLAGGVASILTADGQELVFSEKLACVECGISLPELEPRDFSFNSPHGACPACTGLGVTLEPDPELVVVDPALSIRQGALAPWSRDGKITHSYYEAVLEAVAKKHGFSLDQPLSSLSQEQMHIVLYGAGSERFRVNYASYFNGYRRFETTYEGVLNFVSRKYREAQNDDEREEIERFMTALPCPTCKGARLKKESLAVTVAGKNIVEITRMSISEAKSFFDKLASDAHYGAYVLSEKERYIARQILKEICARLGFLVDVGLGYLTLDRQAATLAGGEAQRIRLATQIGSGLVGVLYILDEPSIGLHQRDNARLLGTLLRLRDMGNTVVVVEHDEETIRNADYIVDMGPGAGKHGGEVVVAGSLEQVMSCERSLTGQYLSGKRSIRVPEKRREGNGKFLLVKGARENNLKDLEVVFPLGKLVCVTGVSGSGKSTLVIDTLYKKLAQVLHRARVKPAQHDAILGVEHIDKVINVDQSPIGRTPRSNPATYTGLFTPIRELFSRVPEARLRGYPPGRFSFNVKGGRCEACMGEGIIRIEMQFLPDVYVTCEVCHGKRYNREVLEIRYRGLSIAEVLDLTVDEAMEFFRNVPAVYAKLRTLSEVGLGYMHLGQPATTLSGGEAQRIKLASELSRRSTGRTLYILDEPTTGLHFADVERLLQVLSKLVDAGNTVIVIEHNLDVIKSADWIIDLGPEGGDEGGYVVAQGTPEEVAACDASHTGRFLRKVLPGWQGTSQSVAAGVGVSAFGP